MIWLIIPSTLDAKFSPQCPALSRNGLGWQPIKWQLAAPPNLSSCSYPPPSPPPPPNKNEADVLSNAAVGLAPQPDAAAYQSRRSWHSCCHPVARSQVSGHGGQPCGGGSNPRRRWSAGRDASPRSPPPATSSTAVATAVQMLPGHGGPQDIRWSVRLHSPKSRNNLSPDVREVWSSLLMKSSPQ